MGLHRLGGCTSGITPQDREESLQRRSAPCAEVPSALPEANCFCADVVACKLCLPIHESNNGAGSLVKPAPAKVFAASETTPRRSQSLVWYIVHMKVDVILAQFDVPPIRTLRHVSFALVTWSPVVGGHMLCMRQHLRAHICLDLCVVVAITPQPCGVRLSSLWNAHLMFSGLVERFGGFDCWDEKDLCRS